MTTKACPLEQYEQVYDKLITDAKAANPKLKLVLGEPFGCPRSGKPTGTRGTTASRSGRRSSPGWPRSTVRRWCSIQHAFDEAAKRAPADYWIWDGVHPTYRGHQIMADEWVKTVRDFWPPPNK